jgi:phosphate transport system substrate-binding protein
MKITLVSIAICGGLVLTGCNSKKNAAPGEQAQIVAAGSTFVYPIMQRWIQGYQPKHPGVQINYQSIGSGGGITQLKNGVVAFGASDAALDDAKLKEMPGLVQIPESAGPVCITYNLPGLAAPLKLSAGSLAGIYMGTIKNWQDSSVAKDNPGVKLPNTQITVAQRSDGSGTTNIFTTYLAAVSPDWSSKIGKGLSVRWPVGVGGKGSEGVTELVKQSPGAIGYVELSYAEANKLPVAQIENQAGKFLSPTAVGTSAAIDSFANELAQDVRTPIVNPPATAAEAYPISGLTFLLVPKQAKDANTGAAVKGFVQYVITDGQSEAEALHYAKLPDSLAKIDEQLLQQVQGGGAGSGN